jgi:hypothetical protein
MGKAWNWSAKSERASAIFRAYWPSLVVAAAGIAAALLALSHGNKATGLPLHPRRWVLVVILGFIAFLGEAEGIRRQRHAQSLIAELERVKSRLAREAADRARAREALEALARVELASISADLGFRSNERVSLFARAGDHLELVARFSMIQKYNHAGRRQYALQGCLGRAWDGLVEPLVVPVTRTADPEEWAKHHEATGLPAELVQALSMPVRTLVAMCVTDPLIARKPLGVVVFESTSTSSDIRILEGAKGPVLDPSLITKRRSEFMPRLQGVLSILCDVDGSVGRAA